MADKTPTYSFHSANTVKLILGEKKDYYTLKVDGKESCQIELLKYI